MPLAKTWEVELRERSRSEDMQSTVPPWPQAAHAQEVIEAHRELQGPMLPILHALQAAFGCVPPQAEPLIATALNLSRAEVFGIITFYHEFRRAPAGRHVLRLCRAEACQAMGADALARDLLARLQLDWGGTTPTGALTVEPVFCLGLCACAPAALLDDEPLGRVNADALDRILAETAA